MDSRERGRVWTWRRAAAACGAVALAAAAPGQVRISAVYGGGGLSTAGLNADYVELFNAGATPRDLAGWSLQYQAASAVGPFAASSKLDLSGTIPANGYFLIRLTGESATGIAPSAAADLAFGAPGVFLDLPSTTGKLALANAMGLLASECATTVSGGAVVDFVGYGSNANCREPQVAGATLASNAPGPSTTTAIVRAAGGAIDRDVNSADFSVTPVTAGLLRNSGVQGTGCPAPDVPVVTNPPDDMTACADAAAVFTVEASGGGLAYLWQQSTDGGATWLPATGASATTATLSVAAGAANGTRVRCIVANGCGQAVSAAAVLTVNPTPGTPTGQTIYSAPTGTQVTMTVTVGPGETADWFTGGCGAGAGGTPVAGGAGTTSLTLTSSVASTTTYFVRARNAATGCVSGACHAVTLTAAPSNDACAAAIAIPGPYTGTGASVVGSHAGAMPESNPLTSACFGGSGSMGSKAGVWYRFTGTGNQMRADVCQTAPAYDTVLMVMCGACDGLTCVASNDDSTANGCTGNLSSTSFSTSAGTTYYVWVGPFSTTTQSNSFTLRVIETGANQSTPAPCGTCTPAAMAGTDVVAETESCTGALPGSNDGCDSGSPQFRTITLTGPVSITGTARALGVAGSTPQVDRDWYRFQAPATDTILVSAQGQAPLLVQLRQLGAGGVCTGNSIVASAQAARCATANITSSVTAGNWYAVRVSPDVTQGFACGAAGYVLNVQVGSPTPPAATPGALPEDVAQGCQTLLTVAVSPGTNPMSTGIGVTADLSAIGLGVTEALRDDGLEGDAAAGDGVYSLRTLVPPIISTGAKTLMYHVSDAQGRTAQGMFPAVSVVPFVRATGSTNPPSAAPGTLVRLTVVIDHVEPVGPGNECLPSTGMTALANLSAIGGPQQAVMTVANSVATLDFTVPANAPAGPAQIAVLTDDAEGRAGTTSVAFNVAPGNDVCAGLGAAHVIPGTGGVVQGSLVGAMSEGAAASSCQSGSNQRDVYYAFTPATSCGWRLSTCGGAADVDTIISVHSACPEAGDPHELAIGGGACADQGCVAGNLTLLELPPGSLSAGVRYIVRVSLWSETSTTGAFTLTATPTTLTPSAPATVSADVVSFCADDAPAMITLTATGGSGETLEWYAGDCPAGLIATPIGTGSPLVVAAPTSTTTYRARWVTICEASVCGSIEVEVRAPAQAPTAAAVEPVFFCAGDGPATITLTATGGAGETIEWLSGGCGGTVIGTGATLVVAAPAATTTYHARWSNSCGVSGCAAATVEVRAAASVQAGTYPALCPGQSVTLAGIASGTTATVWTTSGDGTFDDAASVAAVYTPGGADIAAGSVMLTLTGTPAPEVSTCGAAPSSSAVVTINPDPVAPTGLMLSATEYCTSDAPANLVLTITGGSGDDVEYFSGACGGAGGTSLGTTDGGALTISAPSETTTYFAVWRNGCGASSCASAVVTVTPGPVAPTGASADVAGYCDAAPPAQITLTAAGGSGEVLEWRAGTCDGTLVGEGSPLTIAAPAVTTTYFARWTHPCGSTACASATVTVSPLPSAPFAAGAESVCAGESARLTAAVGPGEEAVWYAGACGGAVIGTGPTIDVTPTATTTYYVAARDVASGCVSGACAEHRVFLKANPVAPTAIDASVTSFCENQPPATVTLTAMGGSGDIVEWFRSACAGAPIATGAVHTEPAPTVTTTYFARWHNECGDSACASVTITVDPAPTPPTGVAADPPRWCLGAAPASIELIAAGGSGETVEWFAETCEGTPIGTGATITIAAPPATATYLARWRSGCGESECRAVTVSVQPLPPAPTSIGASAMSLCGPGTVTLTATLPGTGEGRTLEWFSVSCPGGAAAPIATGASIERVVDQTTEFFVRTRDDLSGCVSTACLSVAVTVSPVPTAPTIASATPAAVCIGETATVSLSAVGGEGGEGAVLRWYLGACGAGASIGEGGVLVTASPSSAAEYFARWESVSCGNSPCASVSVGVQMPPTAGAGGPYAVCSEGVALVSGIASHAESVQWTSSGSGVFLDPGDTVTVYLPSEADIAAGTVMLTLTAQPRSPCAAGAAATAALTISASPEPPTDAMVDRPAMCAGEFPTITLTAAGGSGVRRVWTRGGCTAAGGGVQVGFGSPLTIAAPSETTTYFCRWVNECGSSSCAAVTVTVNPEPVAPVSATADRTQWCAGSVTAPATVALTATGGSGDEVEWRSGACETGPIVGTGAVLTIAAPVETTTYHARWRTVCGASGCASVTITIDAPPSAPTGAAVDAPAYCEGSGPPQVTLTATGGSGDVLRWYAASCPSGAAQSIGDGSPLTVAAPAGTTAYFARWETAGCGDSDCVGVTVEVAPPSVAPTGLNSTSNGFCAGTVGDITLTAAGGSGDVLEWYANACAAPGDLPLGLGPILTVAAPTETTTYFARWVNACDASPCAALTVEVRAAVGACCEGVGLAKTCRIAPASECAGPTTAQRAYRGDCTTCEPTSCCGADFNNVGGVSIQDIFDYLTEFFGTPPGPAADFNNSGNVSVQDLFDLLTAYFAGCGG